MSEPSLEKSQRPSWLPFLPFILFLLLGLVFFMSIGRDPTLNANGMVGQSFPEFSVRELVLAGEKSNGERLESMQVTRADLIGKLPAAEPWILNVWASWCPQCYLEHGFIEALASAGAPVIGLNYKDTQEKANGFLQKMGNPYHTILADTEGELGFDLGVSGAPETYLIDGQGQIVVRHAGVLDRAVWKQKFAPEWARSGKAALFSEEGQ